jgi:hypothetical protein
VQEPVPISVWQRLRLNYYADDVLGPEVDVDGRVDHENNVRYLGKAWRQPDGKYHCLAIVGDALCRVEVTLTPM